MANGPAGTSIQPSGPAHGLAHRLGVLELVAQDHLVDDWVDATPVDRGEGARTHVGKVGA
jgi:hypothetical protein